MLENPNMTIKQMAKVTHVFFKGLHKSIKIPMVPMTFVTSQLMDTMHPNQNEENYNTILTFLLG